MQQARRQASHADPTTRWSPRIQTRWTLVDAIGSRGEPYILARENCTAGATLGSLTERERQVVVSAAYGRSNKEIAYELGISHSTARVLLARACARLGVPSRAALLRLPAIRALHGQLAKVPSGSRDSGDDGN